MAQDEMKRLLGGGDVAKLADDRLEKMIVQATACPQLDAGNVVAFRKPAMWGGSAALAASVMLGIFLWPSEMPKPMKVTRAVQSEDEAFFDEEGEHIFADYIMLEMMGEV